MLRAGRMSYEGGILPAAKNTLVANGDALIQFERGAIAVINAISVVTLRNPAVLLGEQQNQAAVCTGFRPKPVPQALIFASN